MRSDKISRRLAGLAAIALAAAFASGAALAQQVVKIATLAPDGSAWMRELRKAAAEVQVASAGRVQVKFYPGGVMGSDTVVLRKIRLGQLQGGVLTSSELAAVYPDAAIYSMPFLFDSWEQLERARAQVDPLLAKGFEAKGFKMLAPANVGFAYLMSARPLRNRADFNAAKLWIPRNDMIAERTFKAGGVSPILLELGDVYTSLQTGLVDTVANTPAGAVALQWQGKLRTMLDFPLSFVVGFVVMDLRQFEKMSPPDQAAMVKAFRAAGARVDAGIRRDDAAALAAMKTQGLQVTPMPADEAARWRQIGAKVTREMEADHSISSSVLAVARKAAGGH
jgi:TRAP-type C4-dicarboxylate transport system substrate-binding protein